MSDKIEITDITILPNGKNPNRTGVVAYAEIIINDSLIIRDFKILMSHGKAVVKFPEQDGVQVVFPMKNAMYHYVTRAILKFFELYWRNND